MKASRVVLGIDPGSLHTGFGVLEQRGRRLRVLDHGRISVPGRLPLPDRLVRIGAGLEAIIAAHAPEVAVLEAPFLGRNSRSLIVLAQARGAILLAVARAGLAVQELAPAQVKSAVAGSGRATKDQVERMVRLLLKPEGPLSEDAADALAVALCFAQSSRVTDLLTKAK